jgi:hypothetical protein
MRYWKQKMDSQEKGSIGFCVWERKGEQDET